MRQTIPMEVELILQCWLCLRRYGTVMERDSLLLASFLVYFEVVIVTTQNVGLIVHQRGKQLTERYEPGDLIHRPSDMSLISPPPS
jgi:hypothetical protein